jgi:hypothetical protein
MADLALDKDTVEAIIAAIEAKLPPLEARLVAIAQERSALAAEERRVDKALKRWRAGLATAQEALALLFDQDQP